MVTSSLCDLLEVHWVDDELLRLIVIADGDFVALAELLADRAGLAVEAAVVHAALDSGFSRERDLVACLEFLQEASLAYLAG